MAAQHLPRYLGGLAMDKTRSNERRRSSFESFKSFSWESSTNIKGIILQKNDIFDFDL